ncbi:MAG: TolC family protein, partial [Acidithiobacillus sp.]
RTANLHLARAQAQSVQYQVAWQEWMVANQTRMLARQLYYLQKQEAVSQTAATTTDQLYRISVQNLRLGDATITTTALRQIAWLDSQDRQLALRRQVTRVRQDLNKVMGLPPEMHLALRAPEMPRNLPAAARLVPLADTHRLDLLALRAGYQAQEARIRRAILGQYPGFTIGISRAADTSNIQTIGPSIHLDIPLWNRNRGVIAESEATRAQLHAAYTARLFQTRADITALVADLHRLHQEITPLEQQVPQLQSAEQRLRGAAVEHNVTLIDYEAVRSQALAKSLQLLALKQAYAEQQAALEMAVGLPWQQWSKQR